MKNTKKISQNRFDLFRMGKQNNFDSSKISSIECKAGLRNLDRIILNRRPSSGFKMTVHFHVFFHLKKGVVRAKRMVIMYFSKLLSLEICPRTMGVYRGCRQGKTDGEQYSSLNVPRGLSSDKGSSRTMRDHRRHGQSKAGGEHAVPKMLREVFVQGSSGTMRVHRKDDLRSK